MADDRLGRELTQEEWDERARRIARSTSVEEVGESLREFLETTSFDKPLPGLDETMRETREGEDDDD